MTERFLGIWLLLTTVLIAMSTAGICGELHLVFPEPQEAEEEKQNGGGSLGEATETRDAIRSYLRESGDTEIEKAWVKVKKPIYISVAGGVYSEDRSAVDAFMKGYVRQLTATNEFEITYVSSKLDEEGNYPNPSYMLNMLMDKAQGGLYYGHISVSKVYHICRCKDGFEFRLSEEVPFSADIFCNYSLSRLVELGAQYARQTHNAIERDLLKGMGFFWFAKEGGYRSPLKGNNSFWIPTAEPPSEIAK